MKPLSRLAAWLRDLEGLLAMLDERNALASAPLTNWDAMREMDRRIGARLACVTKGYRR